MKRKKIFSFSLKDFLITLLILSVTVLVCSAIKHLNNADLHVSMAFCLAVLLISRFTKGYFYGIFSSVLAIILINYFFTYPYYAFNMIMPGYPITIVSMLCICIITSASTTQILEKEKVQAIADKERTRANLLRAVSHDLRTPLTSIMGAAGVLIDNDEKIDKNERTELLEGIQEDAQWLVRMVENLLSVTRISGESEITKTSEPVEEIVSEAVIKLKKRYKDAPICVSVPDEILFVPMDPVLIVQVLINLMENSIRHGEGVTEISLVTEKNGNSVCFRASDNGKGFSDNFLDAIQSGAFPKGEESGDITKNMGIGLDVCRSIIAAHGGDIKFFNLKNGGACVEFYLPLGNDE